MRINHNIAALNTYRQLTANQSAGAKSLEKLSSGLRINRAGDDAAGLAISEKMRGQIRGLEQASRNAQDGISLIQTAEGALNETHSILQRMRELANQAANDTNVDVDRAEIQKEINQLTSEINRVGNTTEFNTQELLKGDISITGDGRIITGDSYSLTNAGALSDVAIDATSELATGGYKISIANDVANMVSGEQIGTVGSVETNDPTTLDEGSYKVTVAQTTAPEVSGTNDTSSLLSSDTTNPINVSGDSNLTDGTYNINVEKTVTKTATGSNASGISNLDVSAFDDGTRFDVAVDTVIDGSQINSGTAIINGSTTIYSSDDSGAISNLQIASNSTYQSADSYKIKTTQLGDTNAVATSADVSTGNTATSLRDDTLTLTYTDSQGAVQNISVSLTNVQALDSGSGYDLSSAANMTTFASAIQSDINAEFDGSAHEGITYNVTSTSDGKIKIEANNYEALGSTFDVAWSGGADTTNDISTAMGSTSTAVSNATDDVKLRFDLTSDTGSGDTVVQSVEASFTNTAGAKTINLGDISFDVDQQQVYASDSGTTDSTVGEMDGQTIDLSDNSGSADVIRNQVSVTKDSDTATTQTAMFDQDGDQDASAPFTFGTDTLSMDIAGADLVGGQTQTTTVDVSTDYSVQLYADADTDDTMDAGEELGNAYTFTEADLADESNVTNIALGAAGNGVFVDLDASALSGLGSGSSATTFIDFTVAAQSTYTAEIQDADGSNGLGTKVLSGSTATETIDLGEGITFAYDGTSLSAGDLYFSVKAGQDNFSATLTNTDTGNDIGSPIDFDAGDKIDFGNGLSIETVVDVEGGDEATFNVEDDTIDNSLSMQIGANMGQSFSVDISDMRAVALGISGKAADEAVTDNDGNTIANASFTTNESVTDGTNNDKVEFALDVSSHEKASAAVDVINNAIENVSAERSKLGAFQNRLEHTINNLGTSAENLTAAESRIRDVDMAKEMMEHTKNNILAQAAQAMLAQANQQPQGVLQLLR